MRKKLIPSFSLSSGQRKWHFFFFFSSEKRHPIALLLLSHPVGAAKENYVETGAVTLGALYCCARLRLSREYVGRSVRPSPAHVLPRRRRVRARATHTVARAHGRENTDGTGRTLRWCFGPANESFNWISRWARATMRIIISTVANIVFTSPCRRKDHIEKLERKIIIDEGLWQHNTLCDFLNVYKRSFFENNLSLYSRYWKTTILLVIARYK